MINYFAFEKFGDKILITNDIGFYSFVSFEEFSALVQDKLDNSYSIYNEMMNKNFVLTGHTFVSSGNAAKNLQNSKRYLRMSTGLHIFVLTNICNMKCRYCQAQSESCEKSGYMTKDIAERAVDIALQSSDVLLTFEMQGGEPLLNFGVLKHLIEYAELNKKDKVIQYSITTNATLLNEEILSFFEKYSVSVSVSLDGSESLQKYNRPMKNGDSSFKYVENSIPELRKRNVFGGAVLTTTNYSLDKWKEIVDTYLSFGLHDMFIRPLTPLGYANDHWDEIGYNIEGFLAFYKDILEYILSKNLQGIHMREMHAMIFLRKMLYQVADNYMELRSPCGATIGQIAYYYDGKIYTCDEGRMIAQMGDDSFCLGTVFENNYNQLISCDSCKAVCKASVLEGLPECSDCVYRPYCGTCPATTYALEGSLFSRTYNNYRCKTYKGILEILFSYIQIEKYKEIFESWFTQE